MKLLPISAILPTRNRSVSLARMLESLAAQDCVPCELIVVDSSTDASSQLVVENHKHHFTDCGVVWQRADRLGAAVQRNEGVAVASQPYILFLDDDILFESACIDRLWSALQSDEELGGVNAMIVNQRYFPPGLVSRTIFRLLHGRAEATYAGLVIGPAINLLPEDHVDLPEVVPMQWLNTGCTLYRRAALPNPPFDSFFTGYSLMEDLTLSLRVSDHWRLANARTARIFHDSQSSDDKANIYVMAAMELVNRHYVMTEILGKRHYPDYMRLLLWEVFQLAVCAARARSRPQLWPMLRGKLNGLSRIRTANS